MTAIKSHKTDVFAGAVQYLTVYESGRILTDVRRVALGLLDKTLVADKGIDKYASNNKNTCH